MRKKASTYELARKGFCSLVKLTYPYVEYAVQVDGTTESMIFADSDEEAIVTFLSDYPNAFVYDEPIDISNKWARKKDSKMRKRAQIDYDAINELIDAAENECISYGELAEAEDILREMRDMGMQDSSEYFELANACFGMDPFEDEDYVASKVSMKRSRKAMRRMASSLEDSVRDWYMGAFPSDDMGSDIYPDKTFSGVALQLVNGHGEDFYDYIGAYDSLIRERIFEELSSILGVDYDDVYDAWLHGSNANITKSLLNRNAKRTKRAGWRGHPDIEMRYYNEWADPDLLYKDYVFNYWDIEDALWDFFLEEEGIDESETYDDIYNIKPEWEDKYNRYVQDYASYYLDDLIWTGAPKTWHTSKKSSSRKTYANRGVDRSRRIARIKIASANFNDFDEMLADSRYGGIAQSLLDEVGEGEWQDNDLYVYDDYAEFAEYELYGGWYGEYTGYGMHDFNGAPNPFDYIDMDAFGSALVDSFDMGVYREIDGCIVETVYGW